MQDRNPRQPMPAFRKKLRLFQTSMPENRYIAWLAGIKSPDLSSRIVIQIPAYRDAELLNTIRSARLHMRPRKTSSFFEQALR